MTYEFLQHYWCFIVALLGALLVFLMFVQGANSLMRLIYNSTGRKWEFTFTTLVTFGGAFFASYPLFYSTSFGGAYWLWMLILFTFVLQAVSYEFQNKIGNFPEQDRQFPGSEDFSVFPDNQRSAGSSAPWRCRGNLL